MCVRAPDNARDAEDSVRIRKRERKTYSPTGDWNEWDFAVPAEFVLHGCASRASILQQ